MQNDVQAYFDAQRVQDPWDALKESGDPLVAYIAQHVPDTYRHHAEELLRILPATEAQVRQWGREQSIDTAVFSQFVDEARAAGAFGDTPADTATPGATERAALEAWARGIAPGQVRDHHIATLMQHVDAIVAAEAPGYEGDDEDDDED